MIRFTSQDTEIPELDRLLVLRWLKKVAESHGYMVGDITYIFCSDERELEVNREFLQHDYYTDTITFSYSTADQLRGDIFISVDTVRSNAEGLGVTYEEELLRVMVHSLIHLTGQNDKTPETRAVMTQKENDALALLANLKNTL